MLAAVLAAVAQTVSNVRFEQVGKTVRICYSLSAEADISIYLSTDGGRTYESTPLKQVTGAVGQHVKAGTDKCAVWDVLAERDRLQGDAICFKVHADKKDGSQTFTVGGVQFTMVYVKGGTFTMGCTSEQGSDCDYDEKPAHSVTLSDYYIGETEVTQALWKAVMGSNPSHSEGDNLPVGNVSYDDIMVFISKLNSLTGRTFRLPTEAEWEYAARGGKKSCGYKYSGSDSIAAVAWYGGNSGGKPHPVAQKQANELGLYDMTGNVLEWCQDWYGSYDSWNQTNPKGPNTGSYRVLRGGSWFYGAMHCRVASRYYNSPGNRSDNDGFRVVLR